MGEPETCARCGITDDQPKVRMFVRKGLYHFKLDMCIEALGAAVRDLQARVQPTVEPEDFDAFCLRIIRRMGPLPVEDKRALYDNLWDLYSTDEPQPEGGEATVPDSAGSHSNDGSPVAPGASADSTVGAPDETLAKIDDLVDKYGHSCRVLGESSWLDREALVSAKAARAALMDAIRAALRAPTVPDPDTLEAWADWYDEPDTPTPLIEGYVLRAKNQAGYVLRRVARAHRAAMSEPDTGDQP